jgi:membrane-bound lytic murein transglycosylase D
LTAAALLACAVLSFGNPSQAASRERSKSEASEPSRAEKNAAKKSAKAERRAEEKRARAQRPASDPSAPAAVPTTTDPAVATDGAPAGGPESTGEAPTARSTVATAAERADAAESAVAEPLVEDPPPIDDQAEPAIEDVAPAFAGVAVAEGDPVGTPPDSEGAVPVPAPNESLVPEDFEDELEPAAGTPAPSGGDAASLLADSLAAYESAHAFWEQGLIDEAFAALDRAYQRMAEVDVEGDPLRAQEKEDLRRLISRRVVEIYASRLTAAGDVEGSIPLEINEHVQREILGFTGPERQFFLDSYVRAGQYRSMILEELRGAGMPPELAWLPLVESGFKTRAYSSARALGLWQFIASTGYRFGLERNNWIDERMDPDKSTRAAIAYLNELHALFGDWLTALAAYNCGEHLLLRLLSAQPVSYFDHFWDLYLRLPRETRRYVPRFLAVIAILEDPAAYGFDLPELMPPLDFEVVRTERTADLGELERRLQLADGTIKSLNPELRRNATPAEPYDVRVPRGTVEQVAYVITQLPTRVAAADVAPSGGSSSTHRVRPGETLSRVAARYGTTVDKLVALNGLRSADQIWPGQSLRVRSGSSAGGATAVTVSTSSGGSATTHRVRRGDNLWLIAQRYGTTVDRIKRDNSLRSNLLQVGQKLVIHGSRAATGAG